MKFIKNGFSYIGVARCMSEHGKLLLIENVEEFLIFLNQIFHFRFKSELFLRIN